jgi:ATP-binding cassette subfamily B (MDR/TAP) protein 1
MFKMMCEPTKIDSMSDQGLKPEIEGEIRLDNIEFSYPRAPEHKILHGLSLRAEAAKSLALVGEFFKI